ncbi:hypothetical protein [Streptomyces sp. NBC_01358]|uniref:hypothetical protein n=1 Tax=Streptomyces sp. NBC_01358 TaxID=2903837 RepID=UPI002E35A71B|nr:hypothetical protein [Streptomyces sp. NBC_01358]
MARAATDIRPAKKTAQPLYALRQRLRDSEITRVGEAVVDNLLRLARLAAPSIRTAARSTTSRPRPWPSTRLSPFTTAAASAHRHLLAEAHRHLARTLHGHNR